MPSLGDILKSLNVSKDPDLIDEYNKSDYVPFTVNRAFSFYPDTLLIANEINIHPHIEKLLHYKYYLYAVKKKSRYTPWLKASKDKDIEFVKEYYMVSGRKAKEILPLLSQNDLKLINTFLEKGGKVKK